MIAESNGLDPSQITYVGDRFDNDVEPARQAGMVSVFSRRDRWAQIQSHSGRFSTPTHVIDDLSSLPGVSRGIQALTDLRALVSTSGASQLRAGIAYRRAARIAAQGKPVTRKPPHKPDPSTAPSRQHGTPFAHQSPESPNEIPPKPPPSQPSPAPSSNPVADFVTTWAGYDNRNRPA
ncbi:HAD hydrolase-like protein [Burkholderia lata]|uniref:HAD family hydrolase n=1 Tax=Burkholderia lata (strain ATCC 17760 / DSM 23089 / LMG 22485 / NCIMB 9086 / R18194 / 383) TaxID=482957 RepID=UPI0009F30A57